MNDPNLMILAAGVSSRMKQSLRSNDSLDPKFKREAQSKPKAMMSVGVGNRPFLDYLLYNAGEAGYRDVLIVVSEEDTSIQRHYGAAGNNKTPHGLRMSFAVQQIPAGESNPLGTADAVLQGMDARSDWKGKQFTVCNSDNLYSKKAFQTLLESRYPNAMIDYDRTALGFDASRILKFSITQKDDEGFLTGIIEKPTDDEVERVRGKNGTVGVSMNIFRLAYDEVLPFVSTIPVHPVRNEKELPTAIARMVRERPKSVFAFPLAERVPDLTSIDDLKAVEEYVSREFKEVPW